MRFEDFRYGLLRPVVATFYHWSAPEERNGRNQLTKESITDDQVFYVSDDIHSWAAPWVNGMKLYAVDVLVRRPMPLFEQMMPRELMDGEIDLEQAARCHYDSVIYTPHPLGRGVREMCLLHPDVQIQSIIEVKNVDLNQVRKEQTLMHPNWSTLRGWDEPAEKAIPPWEAASFAYDVRSKEPLEELKNDAFHKFMEDLKQAVQSIALLNQEQRDKLSPESAEKRERIELIKGYSADWHEWQKQEARRCGIILEPDEIIVAGDVFDYTTDLETIAGAVLRDQHQRTNAKAWSKQDDKPAPLDPQTMRDRELAGERLRIDTYGEDNEIGLDSLGRAEREITIKMLPPQFHEQQKIAAERDNTVLNPDEMIINHWVFTWEHGIGEILEALESDREAKAALAGVDVEVIALQLKANQERKRAEHEARMKDPRTYESVDYADRMMMDN
jgi:hypothetical protein